MQGTAGLRQVDLKCQTLEVIVVKEGRKMKDAWIGEKKHVKN